MESRSKNKTTIKMTQSSMSRSFDFETLLRECLKFKFMKFNVLESVYHIYSQSENEPYIKEYIDSINAGKPDRDSIIRKYAVEVSKLSEDKIDYVLEKNPHYIRLYSEFQRIDEQLKPIFNILNRDKKIDDLLDNIS